MNLRVLCFCGSVFYVEDIEGEVLEFQCPYCYREYKILASVFYTKKSYVMADFKAFCKIQVVKEVPKSTVVTVLKMR